MITNGSLMMPGQPINVLLIEDNPADQRLIQEFLAEETFGSWDNVADAPWRFRVLLADSIAAGTACLEARPVDIVLLDLSLPDSGGLETFTRFSAQFPKVPVVVLSGLDDNHVALEAVRRGAQDYLVKSRVNGKMLARVLTYAIERRRLDKLKDEFVSTVSHEIRTPLTIIKGSIENLSNGLAGPLTEKQRHYMAMTSRNVERLCKIINDLLDLSRLESGKARLHRHPIDAVPLIREALQVFQVSLGKKAIRLEGDLPPELPPVQADPDMLTQVIHNLLDNACRFTRSRITVQARGVTGGVQVSVIDDGVGVERERLGDLFTKFIQLHRPPGGEGYKGTGLGLAICKEIIDAHEGKIWAESELGHGARFHFFLPSAAEARLVS